MLGDQVLPGDWKAHLNSDSPRPFNLVSQNLQSLGSLSVDHFLFGPPVGSDSINIPYHIHDFGPLPPSPPLVPSPPPMVSPELQDKKEGPSQFNPAVRMQNVARLHQTCQRVFGSSDALNFEFLEEDGPNSKQCILTITRPNGSMRSYKTEPNFSRKNGAKSHAASIAIEMGAIDFIVAGDSDTLKAKKGLLLAPLDAPDRQDRESSLENSSANAPENDPAVKEIEDCCIEWRGGLVKPHWVALTDPKFGNKHGCALRIQLTAHSLRVYSSNTTHDNPVEAKNACVKIAIDQGVLDYIKHGNGQIQPFVREPHNDENTDKVTDAVSPPPIALSLQTFYEGLPQPFPEPFGDKTAPEINAPAWLNTTIQAARGGKLCTTFIWINDGAPGLHGCLLRVDRAGESKSYLVDPRFPKRADAKAAVCLLAMSQRLGSYIRAVGLAAESKLTPEMRKLANEQYLPALASECNKVRPGAHPVFEFNRDRDAYGCTMKVDISLSANNCDIREYNAPSEYRTKADAKAAVAYMAVQQGVIELLRFRGEPLPPDYTTFLEARSSEMTANQKPSNKRKEPDDGDYTAGQMESQDRKKRKKNNKGSRNAQGNLIHPKEPVTVAVRPIHALPSRPPDAVYGSGSRNGSNNGSWKKPHAFGSSGLDSIGGSAQTGRPIGQYRPGSRDVGDSTMPNEGAQVDQVANPITRAPTASNRHYSPIPDGRLGYRGGHTVPHQFAPQPVSDSFPRPLSSHLNHQTPSSFFGGAASYPPQYIGPHSPGAPLETIPTQMSSGPYQLPQFQQQYAHPGASANYPPHPQAVYAAGPAPVVAAFPAANVYHSANYLTDYSGTHPQSYHSQNLPVQFSSNSSQSGQNFHYSDVSHSRDRRKRMRPLDGQDRYGEGFPKRSKNASQNSDRGRRLHSRKRHRNEREHEPFSYSPEVELPTREESVSLYRSEIKMSTQSLTKDHISKPAATETLQDTKHDAKHKVATAIERVSKSHVAALLDYCSQEHTPRPQFHNETVVDRNTGESRHKVWVRLGTERLELPVTFSTLSEGQERVARQVLSRLRSREKKESGQHKP